MSLFKFEARRVGEHVHVIVRVGDPCQRALCGQLTMQPAEWQHFRMGLDGGFDFTMHPGEASDVLIDTTEDD